MSHSIGAMEQLLRLCFLVLLISWVDQVESQPLHRNTTPTMEPEPPSRYINSTWITTDVPSSEVTSSFLAQTNATSMESNSSTWETTTVPSSEVTRRNSSKMERPSSDETSPSPETITKGTPKQTSSSWGYVVLGFIILIIIVLCLILYFIRKASRSYSFDLHRPTPINNRNEPIGTFEQVYLDDFERPDLKDLTDLITDDTSSLPVANGTSPIPAENDSGGENAPQEQADDKSVGSTSTSETSLTLADNQDGKKASPPVQGKLFLEAAAEQENENNNNPSICSSDPFVEINLDEPAWRDQLLSPSQTSPSVTPFSNVSCSPSSTVSSISFS